MEQVHVFDECMYMYMNVCTPSVNSESLYTVCRCSSMYIPVHACVPQCRCTDVHVDPFTGSALD